MSERSIPMNAVLSTLAALAFFILFSALRLIRGEFTLLSSLGSSILLGIIAFVFFYFRPPLA